MTTTAEAPAEPTAIAGLRAVRQSRTTSGRKPIRKAAPRKATTPAASRADTAAKKGRYVDRIVGAIKSGAALWSVRQPVQAAILIERAEPLALALQRVADEDKRVDAFLGKVSGWFGKSSAWGELAGEVGVTGAAMALSMGVVPAGAPGMAIAFMGGELLDAGLRRASLDRAKADLDIQGIPKEHPEYQEALRQVSAQYYDHFKASIPDPKKPAPAEDPVDVDQDVDETQVVITEPTPAWAP
jgi:hypothetical protein